MSSLVNLPQVFVNHESFGATYQEMESAKSELERLQQQMMAQRLVSYLSNGVREIQIIHINPNSDSRPQFDIGLKYDCDPDNDEYWYGGERPAWARSQLIHGMAIELFVELEIIKDDLKEHGCVLTRANAEDFLRLVYGDRYEQYCAEMRQRMLESVAQDAGQSKPKPKF